MHERRIRQRRKCRANIVFPIKDGNDCIVPFDRSRIADRRLQNLLHGERVASHLLDTPWTGCRESGEAPDTTAVSSMQDGARNFCISGEMIAIVNNLYTSQSPGRWKELELYRTPDRQYVCLEIWRTTWSGERDQYWLVTCKDLKAAQEFFGNNWLACELFSEAYQELREQGD